MNSRWEMLIHSKTCPKEGIAQTIEKRLSHKKYYTYAWASLVTQTVKNPCLLHWQVSSLPLNHKGSPVGWMHGCKTRWCKGQLSSMYHAILYKGLEFSRFCCWQVVLKQILCGYGRQLYLLWAVSILRSIILTHLWDFNSLYGTWHIVSH